MYINSVGNYLYNKTVESVNGCIYFCDEAKQKIGIAVEAVFSTLSNVLCCHAAKPRSEEPPVQTAPVRKETPSALQKAKAFTHIHSEALKVAGGIGLALAAAYAFPTYILWVIATKRAECSADREMIANKLEMAGVVLSDAYENWYSLGRRTGCDRFSWKPDCIKKHEIAKLAVDQAKSELFTLLLEDERNKTDCWLFL